MMKYVISDAMPGKRKNHITCKIHGIASLTA
jgi:hypothetical protein